MMTKEGGRARLTAGTPRVFTTISGASDGSKPTTPIHLSLELSMRSLTFLSLCALMLAMTVGYSRWVFAQAPTRVPGAMMGDGGISHSPDGGMRR